MEAQESRLRMVEAPDTGKGWLKLLKEVEAGESLMKRFMLVEALERGGGCWKL